MKEFKHVSKKMRQISHDAIAQSSDGIFWLDSESRIRWANEAACRLLGYSWEELHTMAAPNIDMQYPIEEGKEEFWGNIRQLGTLTFESRLRRKDGSVIPVEISSCYVEFEATGYGCIFFRDISLRKRAEQALMKSENRLSAIINHHFQLTGLLSPSGRLLMANQTALNMVGMKEEDVVGKYFWDTPWWSHSPRLQKNLQESIQRAAQGEFVRFQATHPDIHGNHRLIDFSLNPVTDHNGNLIHIIPEGRDITEIKRTESALLEALTELEQLKSRLEDENVYLQEEIKLDHNFGEIIGNSKALKQVLHQVEQVASTDFTVLILGETGTGKELIARAVHELSARKSRPLVKVNCATLPSHLVESELFGHEKGAFTGAVACKVGRFELADRGTIFLDEIGDLPLELQVKLLRALQEAEFEHLGGSKTIKVNVRVIAATNRNLERLIQRGRFRKDLFYRLNVYPITIPPLRERREDIALLVNHFVTKYSAKVGKHTKTVPKKMMEALRSYHWPGNIRELENIIERALVISQGKSLEIGDWFSHHSESGRKSKVPTLNELEHDHILKVMNLTHWRVRGAGGAAEKLGLKPTTLEARMKKLGIQRA